MSQRLDPAFGRSKLIELLAPLAHKLVVPPGDRVLMFTAKRVACGWDFEAGDISFADLALSSRYPEDELRRMALRASTTGAGGVPIFATLILGRACFSSVVTVQITPAGVVSEMGGPSCS